jgi:hypothetical protein
MYGVLATFRGEQIRVVLNAVQISLELSLGGMSQGGVFRCRFLAEHLQSPPRVNESLIYQGRTYIIREVVEPVQLHGEHIAILTPGSKQ